MITLTWMVEHSRMYRPQAICSCAAAMDRYHEAILRIYRMWGIEDYC
jgi:hypothetical protein